MDNQCIMTSELKALGGCSSHHLQGGEGHSVLAPLQATQLVVAVL